MHHPWFFKPVKHHRSINGSNKDRADQHPDALKKKGEKVAMFSDIWGTGGVIALVLAWIYQGFDLKFIDKIVDDNKQVHAIVTWAVMIVSAMTAGFFMAVDAFTGGCVIALILGMILANKIDAKLWFVQIILVLGAYIAFLNIFFMVAPALVANFIDVLVVFVIVLAFSILDEIAHDASEKKASRFLDVIGGWRMLMKAVAVAMAFVLPGIVAWYHVVAWLLFDIAYEIEARHGK